MAKARVGHLEEGLVGLGQVEGPSRLLLQRIRAEFIEMPGLSVTVWQATRLWNLDVRVCREVLDVLVQGGFLTETRHGAFRRVGGVG